MSFLKGLGGGDPAATGLGRLINTDPSQISQLADRIGTGMNTVATAGGAAPGYAAPPLMNNHLQTLDPRHQAMIDWHNQRPDLSGMDPEARRQAITAWRDLKPDHMHGGWGDVGSGLPGVFQQ